MVTGLLDAVTHEVMLFAAIGFAIGGLDDLLVDMLYGIRLVALRLRRDTPLRLAMLRPPPTRIAVFVAAWDESEVIGGMVRTALARFGHGDYRIYIGTYPNDRATIDAVTAAARGDPRVRLVVGELPGPTTKAHCLNVVWRAMLEDEASDGRMVDAIVLHDAEDVVHAGELQVYAHFLAAADIVQIPVSPLVDRSSRFVSGHYLDEFTELHAKQALVRQALGAAMPLAGVGCAIARSMMAKVAQLRGGVPFDATSLVEDYELGLTVAGLGGRAVFARVAERRGGPPVAVHAYFPARLDAAVRQKARWMTGIALAGWDRIGWGRRFDLGDHWMRMRDRRALIALLLLLAAYAALVGWALGAALHWWFGTAPDPLSPTLRWLLAVNGGLLLWRTAMRMAFVGAAYGWVEAILSVPRMFVSNWISLLAARRALFRYIGLLRGQALTWDKTRHHFPDLAESGGG
ncbi:glycosyl transferase family protein [Sphingomonas qomolangmaensis]|uniref:Glycosyl transferase family protein n=1 Tax=Sphingomonas qomolangmaensis TaxID=2918765 RepID=A0ABY5LD33_9SPHN|nr:glycosyl transferase family protein [Sphingomonas qomolangmaensis]